MKIVLIPCGGTEWRSRGRLLGRVQVALSDAGRAKIAEWSPVVASVGAGKIFHSSDDLAAETAKLLARQIGASTRVMRELDEVDMGLWAGLTEGQLKQRFRSAYRQLVESPLSVAPPEGEPIAAAVERITQALEKRISQNGVPTAAFVLRPMALAIARGNLEHRPLSELWADSHYDDGPLSIDTDKQVQTASDTATANGEAGSSSSAEVHGSAMPKGSSDSPPSGSDSAAKSRAPSSLSAGSPAEAPTKSAARPKSPARTKSSASAAPATTPAPAAAPSDAPNSPAPSSGDNSARSAT